jgi:uncharacterized protein
MLEAVLRPDLLIAMAATLAAGIVRGFSGFGAAMLAAPIFALLYAPAQAVATVAALGTLASLQLQFGALRHTDWRQIVPLVGAAACTIPLGGLVLLALDPDVMRRGISGLVLVMVLVLMSGWSLPVRPGWRSAVGTGALSGVLNGATGVGGPPVVLYMLASPSAASAKRANLISYYTFVNGGTVLMLLWHGVYTSETVLRTLALWPVQVASLWAGAWLFGHANDATYRRLAMGLLLAVALFGLLYRR